MKLLDTKVAGEYEPSVVDIGETNCRKWMTQSATECEAFIGKQAAM